jgi:predicted nuclease of predicted toxin-antitoxin system
MKVLLDENLPHDLRRELRGHDAFTVQYLGWSGVKNGELLARAAASGFDALLTMDSGVRYEQNLAALPVAVVVLQAASNDLDDLRPLVPRLLDVLGKLRPRTLAWIA